MEEEEEKFFLHLGKMTYAEIGKWRGITEASAKKNFSRIQKELEEYCTFTRYKDENKVFAGIEVTEIFDSKEYVKKKSKGYKQLEKYCLEQWVPNREGNITTNTVTAKRFIEDVPDHILSESTAAKYASKIYLEHFGDGRYKKRGKSGISEEVLGISIDHEPRLLTPEERELYFMLLDKHIISPQKKRFDNIDKEQLGKDFSYLEKQKKKHNKKVSDLDFKGIFDKQDSFNYEQAWYNFRNEFNVKTGGWPITGRMYDRMIFWDEE